jgi:transcriptional/translational regulatory protein YebC/TACO1
MGRAHEVRAASMAKTAAAKSKLNAKFGTLIYVAAKSGIPDPDVNLNLRRAIDKAKREQVSADVIKLLLKKQKAEVLKVMNRFVIEGFGPTIQCLSSNV